MSNDQRNTVHIYEKTNRNRNTQYDEMESKQLLNSSEANSSVRTALTYDEDTNYLLSLTGYFRRMSTRKKALAKLRILEYLTELEINDDIVS